MARKAIHHLLRVCAAEFKRKGYDIAGSIRVDEGASGVVDLVKNRDGEVRVVKSLADPDEMRLCAWLRAMQGKPKYPTLFPRIDAVYRNPPCARRVFDEHPEWRDPAQDVLVERGLSDEAFGFIVREDIVDIPHPGAKAYSNEQMQVILGMRRAVGILARLMYSPVEFPLFAASTAAEKERRITEGLLELRQDYPLLEDENPMFLENMILGVRWCWANGIFINDISSSNCGLRKKTGDLVIRDLGVNVGPRAEPPDTLDGAPTRATIRFVPRRR